MCKHVQDEKLMAALVAKRQRYQRQPPTGSCPTDANLPSQIRHMSLEKQKVSNLSDIIAGCSGVVREDLDIEWCNSL